MKHEAIFILGMHRSGTSALGGVLEALGISMGKKLYKPAWDNPKGFFENENIVLYNETLLFPLLNSNYIDLGSTTFIDDVVINNTELVDNAKKIIEEDYAGLKIFGIKDPRMCILLPFWKKILLDQNIEIKFILPYRNPMEVALSLQKRNGFSIEKGLLLWVRHVLYAEYYSRGFKRVFTTYENLLNKTSETMARVATILDISFPVSIQQASEEINKFLEKDLKHHQLSLEDIPNQVPSFITDIANICIELGNDTVIYNEEVMRQFDQWRDDYDRYTALFYNETLVNEIKTIAFLNLELQRLNPPLNIQLFIDQGNSFSEESSIQLPVSQNAELQEFIFELSNYENITNLRLDPLNDSCIVEIEKLSIIKYDGTELDLVVSSIEYRRI